MTPGPPPLRRYQAAALDAFDATLARGQRRLSLVLPPGGGKTRLGLEAAARTGRPALVLTPSVTVQGQWIREAARFSPGATANADRALSADICVLTYQSLAVVDTECEAADRRESLRSGDATALLDQLHPRGRELIDRAAELAKTRGPWIVVLDECHHLLALWGGLLRAVLDALGEDTIVLGLTATPPSELTGWQAELQGDLFHGCAYAVATPALVKEGELAPYQELLFITSPTDSETGWLATETARFSSLTVELADATAGGLSLLGWLQRVSAPQTSEGAALPWRTFVASEPELAQAALRFAAAELIPLPPGAAIAERAVTAPEAADWATVLAGYATGHLEAVEDEESARLLADIRRILPGLGWGLTKAGLRATTSPVDRLVALSGAKHAATAAILAAEWDVRGAQLRGLVLTDFEAEAATLPASLRSLDSSLQGGSAQAALAALARAAINGVPGGVSPVLVTGRTLAASAVVASALVRRGAASGLTLHTVDLPGYEGSLVQVVGDGFGPAAWTQLATAHLIAGETHCLIGTRGLLGEGWDCPALNVMVDLTSAATGTSVAQLRGRSLRLDPADPDKIASNWTVVCVADAHPRGDADWKRAVRKHETLLALGPDGQIETGITHCLPHAVTDPGAVPDEAFRLELAAASLQRAATPFDQRAAWRIGEPYVGAETPTLRVRRTRDLGVPSALTPNRLVVGGVTSSGSGRSRALAADVVILAVCLAVALGFLSALLVPITLGVEVGCATVPLLVGMRRREDQLEAASSATVDGSPPVLADLAAAVADGLLAAGLSVTGAEGLTIARDPAGWVNISLAGAAAEMFRAALDQVLAPVDEPRHLVARPVVPLPSASRDRRRLAFDLTLGRPVPAVVVWHAVPTVLGRNRAALDGYLAAWSARVCRGRPPQHLATATPEGQGVLDVVSGQDPFGLLAQMRTVWT